MKNKVFILRDTIDVKWERDGEADTASMSIIPKGNLEELNTLLNEGWLIKETIILNPTNTRDGSIQSIVYNLEKTSPASSRKG